jgi:uncharacterized protein
VNSQIFEQARQYAINRLEHELSSALLYHGIAHTRDEVVPAVERLAGLEGIQEEALYLLLTAAWFHDIGYVEQATHHELIGARIAMQVLPSFGYRESEIEIVRWAILVTALPQSPTSLLEEILADADLDVLGREDFMRRNRDLRDELALLGKEFTDEQWYTRQIHFVQAHKYFTASARSSRDTQKSFNITELKNMLTELTRE